jgi:hypothetical protein
MALSRKSASLLNCEVVLARSLEYCFAWMLSVSIPVTHSRSPSLMNTTAPKVFEDSRLENIFVRRWDTRLFITGLLIGSTWLVAAAYEIPLLACACLVFVALIDAARIRSWRGLGSDVYEQLRLLRTNLAELVFLVVVALLIASAQVAFGKMGPALGLVSVTFILYALSEARTQCCQCVADSSETPSSGGCGGQWCQSCGRDRTLLGCVTEYVDRALCRPELVIVTVPCNYQ